jgi:methionine-rich copper-binding protein CopC
MNRYILSAALVLAAASPAFAHAHLLQSDPAASASAASPKELTLDFSEGLEIAFSGVTLTGPSGAVTTGAATLDPKDNKVLLVPLSAPLTAGTYTVAWHALSSDGHKTTGTYSFIVK